ncbi:MAG: TlpA family protein disulfide reductase [Gammaproteobacteria bacterium]|nr:TlpA family protein disulfide reductase [Gammaproteobacteria bacterium]
MIYSNKPRTCRLLPALITALLLLGGCGEQRFLAPDAPQFSLPDLTGGETITLDDYRGDVVYVSFWASWCVPCREEMPLLASLWQSHRDEGFQVIAINVDEDPAAARQFARDHGLEFPLARDADRSVSKLYRVAGYPSHYLVDRRGKVRFSALGFTEADALAVTQEVETLLAEPVDTAN